MAYTIEELKSIVAIKPKHKRIRLYHRWRRACLRYSNLTGKKISTSHEIKTPKIIRERNRRWKLEHTK